MKTIYLAGGCFWGLEKYLSLVTGVVATAVGYANGSTNNPTYEDVCFHDSGHAETVRVTFDPNRISLTFLLSIFSAAIDPTTLNRQGYDRGTQYRTGIYYVDEADKGIIQEFITQLQENYDKKIVIEVKPLAHFYLAEEYHQKYLDKNPGGYCHIGKTEFAKARQAVDEAILYRTKTTEELRRKLTDIQFAVTQNSATEPPFRNDYFAQFAPGIYVDVTTGQPLFLSTDKFESGCGWPSFTKPIKDGLIAEQSDYSLGMERTEVRSKLGNAHLGHVFADGPAEQGGLRYCINSAALRFIPKERMEDEGYGHLLGLMK